MKYRVTSSVPARTKTDFVASIESLTQSLDDLYTAYDAVVAAEGRVLEAEECLHDCHEALESIKKFGVNEINMSILNKDNILNDAIGLEALTVEAISTLKDAEKSMLTTKYVSSLEALESDRGKSFVQKVKDMIAKIWAWLKEWFVSDAKLVAMLKECKFEGKFDPEKKVVGLSKENADKAFEFCKTASNNVTNAVNGEESKSTEFSPPELSKDNETADKLGWSPASAAAMRDKLLSEVSTRAKLKEGINKIIDKLQQKVKGEVNPDGSHPVKGAVASATVNISGVLGRFKVLQIYKKYYNAIGFTLLALDKICKTEAAQ